MYDDYAFQCRELTSYHNYLTCDKNITLPIHCTTKLLFKCLCSLVSVGSTVASKLLALFTQVTAMGQATVIVIIIRVRPGGNITCDSAK